MKFDVNSLKSNPFVYSVSSNTLILTLEFRILLFNRWKSSSSLDSFMEFMTESGLNSEIVGTRYCKDLMEKFKQAGFPNPSSSEYNSISEYTEHNPLVLSGLYSRENDGYILITPKFREVLLQSFPSSKLEETLVAHGLSLKDLGYQRIYRLKKELKKELEKMGHISEYNSKDSVEPNSISQPSSNFTEILMNPYILKAGINGIEFKDGFYDEIACMLPDASIDSILEIYGINNDLLSQSNKIRIISTANDRTSMINTDKSVKRISVDENEAFIEIQRRRYSFLNTLIVSNFRKLAHVFEQADPQYKRLICQQLSCLPKDPLNIYSVSQIQAYVGIKKSTYYRILSDKDYGMSNQIRERADEKDIVKIRQVVEYKGFEKGIRQVYMLMPKVTGEQFSIYRIRRLMNKYGIRTTIRRPSRNRKAMKEMITRNKKANLLMRRFKLHRPNEVRLTDVTYLDYGDGLRAYGSASVDPVTGRLICFVISDHNDLTLALDTLAAMDSYPAKRGAILHSDQGSLYMTDDFQTAVVERKLTQSMSRRGNCWDNAVQESFFGHFKDECHYEQCLSLDDLKKCIAEYSDYYNNERGMWNKGRMTPVEYEKYLSDMSDEEFSNYLANEEKRYLEMKEKAAAKAAQEARDYKMCIKKSMEALN